MPNKKFQQIRYYFTEGLKSVSPFQLISKSISINDNSLMFIDSYAKTKIVDLSEIEKIIIIGAGKASAAMAKKTEEILGDRISKGLIVTKYGFVEELKKIELLEAGHPVPDKNGVAGAERIIELCKNAGKNDLIINLLSGGASSLLPHPNKGITLDDKAKTTNVMLKSGATIIELNTIRKHLSKIKGGKLLNYSYPARMVSLILSDVVGDRLDIIGSGITVEDKTTFKDCMKIIKKYNFQSSFPKSVFAHLKEGYKLEENSKKNHSKQKADITNFIVGDNSIILNRIKKLAELDGYETIIMNRELEGEAKDVAKEIIRKTRNFIEQEGENNKKYCFLYGGETSVTITGNGKGGRNQEMALSAAIALNGTKSITFLSGGTDGNDGPTDAAGAICDGSTINKGNSLGVDADEYLSRNDSYNYFKKIDSLLMTGPTGTNVIDVQIVLYR